MQRNGISVYPDEINRQRKEILFYALAVIFATTLVVALAPASAVHTRPGEAMATKESSSRSRPE